MSVKAAISNETKGEILMANDTIGELIRDARERQKYSQEELSYGICTASTLSRIENGLQVPGKKILEGIVQRLGIEDRIYNVYLCREEQEWCEAERQLTRCLGDRKFEQAEKLTDYLEKNLERTSDRRSLKMEEQYLRFAKVLIQEHRGERTEQVLEELLEIIRMTMPDFDGIHIRTRLLTYHEIVILNSIGCTYHNLKKLWEGLQLLFELKEYIENHTLKGEEMAVKYPMIVYNLSSWLGQEGRYQDALNLCQAGIEYCIEYGKLHTFPMLLFNKACALAELRQYDMSKESFYQSAALFQAINQQERAEQVKRYASLYYGIIISR